MKKISLFLSVLALSCTPTPSPAPTTRPDAGANAWIHRLAKPTTPPVPEPADLRTQAQISQTACTGPHGERFCQPKAVVRASSSQTLGPIIPISWTVPQWYVDPSNVSGTASDNNNCTTTSTPCLTWHEINDHRWGCQGSPSDCPRLRQTTTITFLSSHTDSSDPVYFQPAIETTGTISIQGAAPTVVASGVILSGTTPKSRTAGSNSLLITNLGASGAADLLVQNTTHPSRAWAFKSLGGNSFSMTQPLTLATVPGTPTVPGPEVDTWTNGDSVNILRPVAVNLVKVNPTFSDVNTSTFANVLYLYQITIFSPSANQDQAFLGTFVTGEEMSSERIVNVLYGHSVNTGTYSSYNAIYPESINSNSAFSLFGGYMSSTATTGGGASILDGDIIITGGGFFQYGGETIFGFVYLDSTVGIQGGSLLFESTYYGGPVVYGAATKTIQLGNEVHAFLSVGTGGFTSAFTAPALISPGIQLNGGSVGCSHSGASTDVQNCGITLTSAHLDAAQGTAGCGGNCYLPGGASVANF